MEKELARFTVDFSKLEEYTDPQKEDFPVYSFDTIYKILGVYDFMEKYYKENKIDESKKFVYCENMKAHPDTIVKMRKLIQKNWQTYDLNIDSDRHVFWKKDSKYGRSKHYAKTLTNIINNAVNRDFLDLCPGSDPELPKDVLIIHIEEKD